MDKKLISLICAISCSFLWGTAFIAQDMGMDYIGPFSFSAGRMFLGFITLIPFFFFFEFKKIKQKKISYNTISIYLALLAFFLSGGFALQQYSLLYTDVANAAIFTIFYVLIVPAISYFLFSKKIHWSVWPSVLVCIIGGFLLTETNNVTVRLGDTLVLLGGKIIQELEGSFRGTGWNVIKVIWGSYWDQLLAKDKTGLLVKRMNECVDGEYQAFKAKGGEYVRRRCRIG